ncbi:MAG: DUF928 domain-containing protein [Scytonematopsis contorta HA4267-MV1]|jgi:hypothetical protein|nr:DUF928 domain-containing protein [Scytonematopsis contorta HA4267-MV1]
MTQLAPQEFIGETASTRPMLVWYMSNSQPVRFRLFEIKPDKTAKQIGEQKEIISTVGINKLKLPNEYAELTVGKTYLWQVATDCENDVIVSRAEFTVVNAQSSNNKNELWYEALEEALEVTNNGKISPAASTLIQNLAQLEISMGTPDNIENIKQRAEYLQKISDN